MWVSEIYAYLHTRKYAFYEIFWLYTFVTKKFGDTWTKTCQMNSLTVSNSPIIYSGDKKKYTLYSAHLLILLK